MLLASGAVVCSGGPPARLRLSAVLMSPTWLKVAQHSACVWLVFLGEQPDIVAERQEALENGVGFIVAWSSRERLASPEIIVAAAPGAAGGMIAFRRALTLAGKLRVAHGRNSSSWSRTSPTPFPTTMA
jgi:hypothetical protein